MKIWMVQVEGIHSSWMWCCDVFSSDNKYHVWKHREKC